MYELQQCGGKEGGLDAENFAFSSSYGWALQLNSRPLNQHDLQASGLHVGASCEATHPDLSSVKTATTRTRSARANTAPSQPL